MVHSVISWLYLSVDVVIAVLSVRHSMDLIQREPFTVVDFYLDLQVNLNEINYYTSKI